MNRETLNRGKAIGEVYNDFDLPEDVPEQCPMCGSELEWNGDCSECEEEGQ